MIKNKKLFGILITLLSALFLASCNTSSNTSQGTSSLMVQDTRLNLLGTVITISSYELISEHTFDEAFSLINNIEQLLSVNIDNSEISAINNANEGEYVNVSKEVYNLIEDSLELSRLSRGAFDISIGPIMSLWKSDGNFNTKPQDEEINRALPYVDYKQIFLSNGEIMLGNKNMKLDLGGIAKGYACDATLKYLKSQNINSALLDFGGNIYAHGSKPNNEPWVIGIKSPKIGSNDLVCTLTLENTSAVTSGGYERYFIENDTIYHHIIDPTTGYPSNSELLSVTIIDPSSTKADALSTACFILGLDEGLKLLSSLNESEGIFITRDSKVYITDGLKEKISLLDLNYQLILAN